MSKDSRFDRTSYPIIGACLAVHRCLGPGLLEFAYEQCLAHELGRRGLPFERQVAVDLEFRGMRVERACVADFIVARSVVVELKAVSGITEVHRAQLRTYLKLLRLEVGLLVNFNVVALRADGLRRITYRPPTIAAPNRSPDRPRR
ncbi:MAG: GxxExxY protein [Sandaracinaceae bacterium]